MVVGTPWPDNEQGSAYVYLDEHGGGDDDDDWRFIATVAYRPGMAKEVEILKKFCDDVLMFSAPGRSFVRFYYRVSPSMAGYIGRHETLRMLARWSLLPLVGISWFALKIGPEVTLMLLLTFMALICYLH